MNMDDARWMARIMGTANGEPDQTSIRRLRLRRGNREDFSLEKLASRRDHMVRDLGLDRELPLWRPKGEDRQLNYDPLKDGPFTATLSDGTRVTARVDPQRFVLKGRLNYKRPKG